MVVTMAMPVLPPTFRARLMMPVARLAFSLAIEENAAVLIGTKRNAIPMLWTNACCRSRAEIDLCVEPGHLKKAERGNSEAKRYQPAGFNPG